MFEITSDDILQHPRFAEARAAHLAALTALFRGDRFVTQMMADAGVIHMRGFLVSLHFTFDPGDRTTWATPGNIRRLLLERNLVSSRRVDDILARFRQAGYVEVRPSPADRRTSLLVPTERLIAHDRDHLAAYHRFLLVLYPGRGYEWVLTGGEDRHRSFRRTGMHHLPLALSAMRHAAMRLFLARDAGFLALLLVLAARTTGEDSFTWLSLSRDLAVSRSHLRTLFKEAEAAGYVRLALDRRPPIEVLPTLSQAYDTFLAGLEADQDQIARIAWHGSAWQGSE